MTHDTGSKSQTNEIIPFKNYSVLPINYTSLIETVKMEMIFGIAVLHLNLVLPSVSSYD